MTIPLRSALLLAGLFPAAASAMTWLPFPFCNDTHQVDSIQTSVWIDESLIPENAPYEGHARIRYHPGTCFPARTDQRPYYMDTTISVEATLSPDRRRQDFRWLGPGPAEFLPHGTRWLAPDGEIDSSISHSFGRVEGGPPVRNSYREVRIRSATSLLITSSIRRGDGPWIEYEKDSVVTEAGITTIFTVEEEGSYITRCLETGSTYACTPTPVGEVTTTLNKQVWHRTGNRMDSLRSYRLDGRLESTDHYYWSARPVGIARPRSLPGSRNPRIQGLRGHSADGRLVRDGRSLLPIQPRPRAR